MKPNELEELHIATAHNRERGQRSTCTHYTLYIIHTQMSNHTIITEHNGCPRHYMHSEHAVGIYSLFHGHHQVEDEVNERVSLDRRAGDAGLVGGVVQEVAVVHAACRKQLIQQHQSVRGGGGEGRGEGG